MSRHRNIRSINVNEEYEGYDDVYGHSVEDDYCVSPSEAAFVYDREGSKSKQKISAFFQSVTEENEEPESREANLSEIDKARLESCIEQINQVLGCGISRQELINIILLYNFNVEKAINFILGCPQYKHVTEKKAAIPKDVDSSNIKVVTPGPKTTNVTKGFDLVQKEVTRLNVTPRSQSPASGRVTPVNAPDQNDETKGAKQKDSKLDANEQYKKERGGAKENLYMVVIGHVDAGKSTLMGHLLCALGQVNQKTMHKYEQESRKVGKQSFMYAWVLDETGEERNRGITMDVGRSQFETETKLVTLLDAPGHKDFIPNMISGAGQADVALLVVDATRGEFETGFDFGGQTREHALLVRSLGVGQLAVAINKLDTVMWSQERFNEIVQKLKVFLKHAGFKESDVAFVPCSGLTGQNLIRKPTESELLQWYSGPCLLDVIDNFRTPERPVAKPFRFSINDVFKSTGSNFCVSGRVETGTLCLGERVLVCPSRELATVKGLSIEEVSQQTVFAGDQVSVTLSGIDIQNVSIGYILCLPQNPVQIASNFQARIVVFNVTVPITKGYSVVMHHQSLVEPVIVCKLINQLHKSTGEIMNKHPRCLSNNSSATVEIKSSRPLAIELYSECKELGRIMLRVGGVTIAAGLITKIIL
ncbi:HBS1-like protein isoform X2 [Photinus pyralis]|uniref:HBS1-like protein isoform X2 n=1 Tax=Photinus pyralis TaxID=7054 RepID=UPI001266F3DB|nr:HBS1-like protein isoform X2 [Photinus pyralis]